MNLAYICVSHHCSVFYINVFFGQLVVAFRLTRICIMGWHGLLLGCLAAGIAGELTTRSPFPAVLKAGVLVVDACM